VLGRREATDETPASRTTAAKLDLRDLKLAISAAKAVDLTLLTQGAASPADAESCSEVEIGTAARRRQVDKSELLSPE
jgi:hypothetical protein